MWFLSNSKAFNGQNTFKYTDSQDVHTTKVSQNCPTYARLMGECGLDKTTTQSEAVASSCYLANTSSLSTPRRRRRDSNGHTTYQRFLHRFSGRRRDVETKQSSEENVSERIEISSQYESITPSYPQIVPESLNPEAEVRECGTCLSYQGSSRTNLGTKNIINNHIGNSNNNIDHRSINNNINVDLSSKKIIESKKNNNKITRSNNELIKDCDPLRRIHRKESTSSNGSYNFLWRWRTHTCINLSFKSLILAALFILSTCCVTITDACSSRTTPKPRPPVAPSNTGNTQTQNSGSSAASSGTSTSTSQSSASSPPRPNITFHTYVCPPDYAIWYCLNGATCFTVKIGESLLYNCECADGYMGPRCEYKDLDGSYLPSQRRFMLETASIAGGASVAALAFAALCAAAYVHIRRRAKQARVHDSSEGGDDVVDGFSEVITRTRRPRGPTFGRRNQSPAAGDCHLSQSHFKLHHVTTLLPPTVVTEAVPRRDTAGDA